jgi:hypothetical protein
MATKRVKLVFLLALTVAAGCFTSRDPADGPTAREALALSNGATMTVCSVNFAQFATGGRWKQWQPWNCSNGVPLQGAVPVGQGTNWAGTQGQVWCDLGQSGAGGQQYNDPTWDGATTGTVTCLYIPPASSLFQPSPAMTTCSYTFTDNATGWRYHNWTMEDCSNGLPPSGAYAIGQGQNGTNTEGQVMCFPDHGQHYNHPAVNGATTGTVICTYVSPTQVETPEVTLCSYTFSDYATGWRYHNWTTQDCSHRLPGSNWMSVGQAQNGNGTNGQVGCYPDHGQHYNQPDKNGATSGTVTCLFARVPAPTNNCEFDRYDLNSDGVNDTNLTFGPSNQTCTNGSPCLAIDSCLLYPNHREIALLPDATSMVSVTPTTDLTADGLQELSLLYARTPNEQTYQRAALAVIDPDAPLTVADGGQSVGGGGGLILGDVASPLGLRSFFLGAYPLAFHTFYPKDPNGHMYPLLVPGYGDSNINGPSWEWGWGCQFRYDSTGVTQYPASGSGNCNSANFIQVNTDVPAFILAVVSRSGRLLAGPHRSDLISTRN